MGAFAAPKEDKSHIFFSEGRGDAASLYQMDDSLRAALKSCGGTVKVSENGDQVTLVFKNVKSCSNFTLFSFETGEKKKYKLDKQSGNLYAGSFTIPKAFMEDGLENLALSIHSNGFIHEDKIRLYGEEKIRGPKCSLASNGFNQLSTTVNGKAVGFPVFDLDSAIKELRRLEDGGVCRTQRKDCSIGFGSFGMTTLMMGDVTLSANNFDVLDTAKKMKTAMNAGICRYRNRPECSIGFGNFGMTQVMLGKSVVGQPIFDIFDTQKKINELVEAGACVAQEETPTCGIAKGNFGATHVVMGEKKVGQDFYDIVETKKYLDKLVDAGICSY